MIELYSSVLQYPLLLASANGQDNTKQTGL